MPIYFRRIHEDERGTLSIVSVFTLVVLTFLLGMVVNAARQVDHKVKLQQASDAATYSGGIVLTRAMNTLAFTNHLLCDVFALTAFMREAEKRSAESLTPEILDNWERVAPAFIGSEFPPFDRLGYAIQEKVPREREMVLTFSDWAAAGSELMLPTLEQILADELIPWYQRALTIATPGLTQMAVDETARRHGSVWPRSAAVRGVLWRTLSDPVGGPSELDRRTLPVVDPVLDDVLGRGAYFQDAVDQRRELSHRYLRDWNNESMHVLDTLGKMSQFSNLWRIFTCGELEYLLNVEYPDRNLPFQIRTPVSEIVNVNDHLELDFTFVGVVYRESLADRIPRVFQNPIPFASQAYTQIRLFVPRPRLIRVPPRERRPPPATLGGIPGESLELPNPARSTPRSELDPDEYWLTVRQSSGVHPVHWDLLNQNWTVQLVPAVSPSIVSILGIAPPAISDRSSYLVPTMSGFSESDLQWLSHH